MHGSILNLCLPLHFLAGKSLGNMNVNKISLNYPVVQTLILGTSSELSVKSLSVNLTRL